MYYALFLILILGLRSTAETANPLESTGIKFVLRANGIEKNLIYENSRTVRFQVLPGDTVEAVVLPTSLPARLYELQSKNGAVVCDCGLFVQMAASLLSEPDDLSPGIILPPEKNPADLIACACNHNFVYLRLSDPGAHMNMQNTSFSGKGNWLLPLGYGNYLGILREGPMVGTMRQWKRWTKGVLLEELKERSACEQSLVAGSDEWAELEYVRLLNKNGELGKWTFERIHETTFSPQRARTVRAVLRKLRGELD